MNIQKISAGKKPPEEINVLVEIPQGSSVKYELNKDLGVLVVDRLLHTSMNYPFNYGFIPSTHAEDGDPLDVLLVSSLPVAPGSLVAARPIGALEMEDESGPDNKIIALPLPTIDPHFADIGDVFSLSEHLQQRIRHFFESYKELEQGKWVKTGEFLPKSKAFQEIKKALI